MRSTRSVTPPPTGNLAEVSEQITITSERLVDGSWRLTTGDGAQFSGATLVDAIKSLLPDAPADLVEHLAARDAGTWACPVPLPHAP